MFLGHWFHGLLDYLGLWRKEAKILFLGLDNAGKTTLLHMLKDEADAVVYIVDASDGERFAEAKHELDALLSDESLADVPFVILGNKIDVGYAASEDVLRSYLGLAGLTTGKGNVKLDGDYSDIRHIEVFMCSIVKKMGYGEAFRWVSQYIKQEETNETSWWQF